MALVLRPFLYSLLILTMVSASLGCTVARLAKGEEGTDVTAIQPGVTRANAEAILGPPVWGWTSPIGIRYATYTYDAGAPPDRMKAAHFAVLNLLTVGLLELAQAKEGPLHLTHIVERVVISYDARDVILGLFDEFDEIPPDGRSGPRKWGRAPPESEK